VKYDAKTCQSHFPRLNFVSLFLEVVFARSIMNRRQLLYIFALLIGYLRDNSQRCVRSLGNRLRGRLCVLRTMRLVLIRCRRCRILYSVLRHWIDVRTQNVAVGRQAWVLPRPQFWFNEMLNNYQYDDLMWKQNFRVSKSTFDFICRVVGPSIN